MDFIKLTNATDAFKGNPLYINKDWIITVFERQSDTGGSLITVIFGGPQGTTWEVEEGLGEVVKLLNAKK